MKPFERSEEDARLRLHAFDRRQHKHCPVEHAQHTFDLCNEVRVAGRVEQVDVQVAELECGDRGLDRDPALPFERKRVGLSRARIDAADLRDDARLVEEAFGESRLTGVYMRQDSKVELLPCHASYPPNGLQSDSWT